MCGGGESRFRSFRVAEEPIDAGIVRDVVPEERSVRLGRRGGIGYGMERLVFDDNPFRRIGRGGGRFADRGGDDVADEPDPAVRDHRQLRAASGRAVRVFENQIHEPGDQGIAGDRPDAVGGEIGGGQHVDGARRRLRRRDVDPPDTGMGVRRAQHRGVGLPVEADVVGVAAPAAQEAHVLLPKNRLSDPARFDRCLDHRFRSIRNRLAAA